MTWLFTLDPARAGAFTFVVVAVVLLVLEHRYQRRQAKARRDAAAYTGPPPPSHPNCRCVLVPMWEAMPAVATVGHVWQARAKRTFADGGWEWRYTPTEYTTRRAANVGAKRLAARLNRGCEA